MKGTKFYLTWEDYEENDIKLADVIDKHIKENGVYEEDTLIIGCWEFTYDQTPKALVDYIISNKDKFPNLKNLYLGDIDAEECELSWILQTDTAPLVNEFGLEKLIVKGSGELRFKDMKGESLKELTIISGGINKNTLIDLAKANLNNLTHLELYLGTDEYGFDGGVEDILPFLFREKLNNVKYLGLKNSILQDEICEAIADSDILEGLEVLDLSYGTMTDKGLNVLIKNVDKLSNLTKLDITYNYCSDVVMNELMIKLKPYDIDIVIDNSDVCYDDDDDYRFPYYTE